jgi:drug efflux transport system ATP-binding protein
MSDMPEAAISAHGLVKTFRSSGGSLRAVDDLTFEVAPGETFGLIGPDGAGKTTTVRTVLGLLARDAGACEILGFDSMREAFSIREHTGYIPQQNVLPADLTVAENMRFFADMHGVPASTQKVRISELLEFAGLGAFTGRLAGRLSGGMKKKLALACSLVHQPRMVLLDEPTLGVDPVSRREFWSLLGNLRAERGLTILVCTPYMDEAERCTQVGLLYAGRLIASGPPSAIKARVPGHLVEVTPTRQADARNMLTGMPGVLEVQTYGAKLRVFVDDTEQRIPRIDAALNARRIEHDSVRSTEVGMEEAFISLVSQHTGVSP